MVAGRSWGNAPLNVLSIVTDQHRIDALGCYGNRVGTSPNIDALADESVVFENAFTPTAICTPARATMLTGILPFRHKLLANYERNVGYPVELTGVATFSETLRDAGYNCGLVGKWHVGQDLGPNAFGFDGTHFPGWGNPVRHPSYQAWLDEHHYGPHRRISEIRGTFPNGEPGNLLAGVLDQPAGATFEHFLGVQTVDQLNHYAKEWKRDRRPFHLSCHFFGPHLPYLLPPEDYDRFDPEHVTLPHSMAETFAGKPVVQRHYSQHWSCDDFSPAEWQKLIAIYWGYTALIDRQIGLVLSALRDLELWDDTAIFFTADHGEFTGAHRLNDKGPAMYDDIYRIPLIIRLPGITPTRSGEYVTLTDLPATYLDLAGMTPLSVFDGRSLVPTVLGIADEPGPREVLAEFHGHHFPYPQRMLRTDNWKLVINPAGVNELYDLNADPSELTNLYGNRQVHEVRSTMEHALYERLRTRGDNFFHWMSSMSDVGEKTYDVSLSEVDT